MAARAVYLDRMRHHEIPAWGGPQEIEYLVAYGEQGDLYDFQAGELLSVPVQIPAVSWFNEGAESPGKLTVRAWLVYKVDESERRCDFQGLVFTEPKDATQVSSWRSGAGD